MFRAVPMMQLTLVMLQRDLRAVLRVLGELGAVQLRSTPAGPDTAPRSPANPAAEVARCEHLIAGVETLRASLEIAPQAEERRGLPELTFEQAQSEFALIEQQAGPVLKRREHLLERLGERAALSEQLSSYRGLDVPLDGPERFSFLHFVTGSLPAENLEALQKEGGFALALLPLPARGERQPLVAMTTRQGREGLESALARAGFQRETLPIAEGSTVDTLSEACSSDQASITKELREAEEQVRSLAATVAPALTRIEAAASLERSLLDAERNFPRTEAAAVLSGWVPADERAIIGERVKAATGGRCIIQAAAPNEARPETIPVLLRHSRLLRPFEMLVTAYGLPSYQELEPTLFVALSYVLMFGMMFGDAGHGAVLAAGGLAALLAKRSRTLRDIGILLLFGGLSSMTFGVIYGSYFGLPQLKKYALWHDPLEGDPMVLMYHAIRLGVVMISLGLILNIINRFRRGDVLGGFLDKFGLVGLLFYWGMLTLLVQHSALESRGLVKPALGLFLVLPIVGWSLKEPLEYASCRRSNHGSEAGEGLGAAFTESLVGAFEAVLSYLANTISFVRLAAYAMSHAALLVAAFMMAAEVRHLSFGGGLLSVVVIIAGNLVAIVLEGIIASVQALRLEYYEFFGKFFSGSGQPFKPFRLQTYGHI